MEEFMQEECRNRIYSEEYLDYLVEYFPSDIMSKEAENGDCYERASNRFAVLYEQGTEYEIGPISGVKMIPQCFGLLSSDEVLESAGITQVRRQVGLNLYGQGIMVGFIDTGERVIIMSS